MCCGTTHVPPTAATSKASFFCCSMETMLPCSSTCVGGDGVSDIPSWMPPEPEAPAVEPTYSAFPIQLNSLCAWCDHGRFNAWLHVRSDTSMCVEFAPVAFEIECQTLHAYLPSV